MFKKSPAPRIAARSALLGERVAVKVRAVDPADEQQTEMDFVSKSPRDGLEQWRSQRREMVKKVGFELGLLLNRQVEVWLRGGIRLRGVLSLREEVLFVEAPRDLNLELIVDGVTFRWTEIESCVRTD